LLVKKTISFIWGNKFESHKRSTVAESDPNPTATFKPVECTLKKDIKESIESVK